MRKNRVFLILFNIVILLFLVPGRYVNASQLYQGTTDGESLQGEFLPITEDNSEQYGLFDEDGEELGHFDEWNAIVNEINRLNDKTAVYRVSFPEECVISGNMKMPAKAKYAGLILDSSFTVTGNISMTAKLTLKEGVSVTAKTISGANYCLCLENDAKLVVTSAITVGDLELTDASALKAGGKVTIKRLLTAGSQVEIVLTEKKGISLKDTVLTTEEPIRFRFENVDGQSVSLAQNAVAVNVSGASYAPQFLLLDAAGEAATLYRKGNTLRVRGELETPYGLRVGEEECFLGDYATLADIKTEINRRKDATAVYKIFIAKEQSLKGNIPMPSASAYRELIWEGEAVSVNGGISLTGHFTLCNKGLTVKSVSGGNKTVLEIRNGSPMTVTANLSVYQLILADELSVSGAVTLTEVTALLGNCFQYNIDKNVSVKGNINFEQAQFRIAPYKNGKPVEAYPNGIRLLSNVPKAKLQAFELFEPNTHVFYREGKAVKLGMPLIVLFEGTADYQKCQEEESQAQFVTINDLISYVNESEETDFVARLNLIVPSVGNMTALAPGKHLILCGKNGEKMTLQFTGAINLDGSVLEVRNLILHNKTAQGPSINLKNGGGVLLDNTSVNAISAKEGTWVTFVNETTVNGAISGLGKLTMVENSLIRGKGNIAAKKMILEGSQPVEIRLAAGKRITVSNEIEIAENNYFLLNMVDKKDVLANLGAKTVLVTGNAAEASMFRTENTMYKTFVEWTLIKKGNQIVTSEASAGDGEWSGDFL